MNWLIDFWLDVPEPMFPFKEIEYQLWKMRNLSRHRMLWSVPYFTLWLDRVPHWLWRHDSKMGIHRLQIGYLSFMWGRKWK